MGDGLSGQRMPLMDTRYILRPRSAFASDPTISRGRLYVEPESAMRTAFQRDRDRVLHSSAFRRLKDKTQVFLFAEDDHHRTRLTHTLEVAQIARTISRLLGLDEDLCEALALGHDLGHSPFGHAGERALNRCMQDFGGFDHNAQSLRLVTLLERKYAAYDGLNLSWEVLEGLVKHNGPLIGADGEASAHPIILDYAARHDLWLTSFAGPEAQVAAIADDIAYDAHDLDDGLHAGLFTLSDLDGIALLDPLLAETRALGPLDRSRAFNELVRRLIGVLVEDVVEASTLRLEALGPQTADDIRVAAHAVIGFSPQIEAQVGPLKTFLSTRMYRHPDVQAAARRAEGIVTDLFAAYLADPQAMPRDWAADCPADESRRARYVADFIAGMTDRYALSEHRRLFPRDGIDRGGFDRSARTG
jgi:dGTPase